MPPSGRPTVAVMMPDGPCMPSTVHRSCLFSCLRYLSSPLPHLTAVNQLPPPASLSLFCSPSYLPPTPRNPFILTPLPPPRPCETFLWRRSFWSVGRRAGVVKQNGFLSRPGELAIGMNAGSIAVLNATTTTAWTDRQRSLTDSQSVRAHIGTLLAVCVMCCVYGCRCVCVCVIQTFMTENLSASTRLRRLWATKRTVFPNSHVYFDQHNKQPSLYTV